MMRETFITIQGVAFSGIPADIMFIYAMYAVISTVIDHVVWVFKKVKAVLPKKSVN